MCLWISVFHGNKIEQWKTILMVALSKCGDISSQICKNCLCDKGHKIILWNIVKLNEILCDIKVNVNRIRMSHGILSSTAINKRISELKILHFKIHEKR